MQKNTYEANIYKDIWVTYTSFEGIEYIKTVANNPLSAKATLLRKGEAESLGKSITLYVAKDHLGIRALLFSDTEETPTTKQRPGVWWTTMQGAIKTQDSCWESDVGTPLRPLINNADLVV